MLLLTGYAGLALEDWRLAPGMEIASKPFMPGGIAYDRIVAILPLPLAGYGSPGSAE